ncbi:MAG: RNA polymerase sigma factor [Labrys sp. (in: a-proteobacteria)]
MLHTVDTGLTELIPRLYRFAMSICRNEEDARELVQATCLRALERKDQYVAGSRLDHWTFAILSSIWKNQLRSRKVREGNGYVELDDLSVPDPAPAIERSVLLSQIMRHVDRLPEAQREAVLLVYVEGFSYEDAAQIAQVPVGTITSRLVSARVSIARALEHPIAG